MKTVYLCNKADNIKNVYGTDEQSYDKEYLLCNKEEFKDTEYIFSTWGMPVLTESEIKELLPCLKAVFYGAGSVQGFARPFLNLGIKVFSAWAANAVPVAEYTVAQIILASKGFFKTMRYTDIKQAKETLQNYTGNYGIKVGIIGAGMIGKLVLQMLKGYDIDLMVFDPFLPEECAMELCAKKADLETLFSECTVVSNHLANNEKTKGMLCGRLFEKMPPYSTFLNTGRGAQVVESELIQTLKKRPDITAILDVTAPEPPMVGSELYTLENCILTPHIAGSIGKEVRRMGEYMKEEFCKFTHNQPCKYEVTLEMLETMA